MTLVYGIILLVMLCGFVSLGVDFGHVQLVKTELIQATESAARAAASQLSSSVATVQNTAVTWAGYNKADMATVVVDPINDVDFGTWTPATHTFTVLTGASRSTANAVRVWAHRTAANGNAVRLSFGAVIGRPTCDVNASAVAYAAPATGNYGIVGLSSATLSSSVITNSYSAALGSYGSQTPGTKGYVGSNGTVKLQTSTTVNQDVYMVAGQTLTVTGGSTYGSRNAISSNIAWPTPSAGSYATSNDNGSVGLPTTGASASFSSGSFSVPPGHYYLDSFTMDGGTLNITGPTTIYMNGSLDISGGAFNVTSGHPGDLMIYMVKASTLSISGGSDIMADIQAPTSTVTISGIAHLYGRVIGKSLTITGTDVHVDTSLPTVAGASTPSGGGASSGGIQTVR
jgi:hypothetical protein